VVRPPLACPANSGSGPNLFDDGVGAQQERFRDGNTYGFRGLEIDREIELRGLLDSDQPPQRSGMT
jgi:hypothetical protein